MMITSNNVLISFASFKGSGPIMCNASAGSNTCPYDFSFN